MAVVVLGLALLPIAFSFTSSRQGLQLSLEELAAHQAAFELMEQLACIPAHLLPAGQYTNDQIQHEAPIGASTLAFRISPDIGHNLYRTLTIDDVRHNGRVAMKALRVRVSWVGRDGGPPKDFQMTTLLALETY